MMRQIEEWSKENPFKCNLAAAFVFAALWGSSEWLFKIKMETYVFGACILLISSGVYSFAYRAKSSDLRRSNEEIKEMIDEMRIRVSDDGDVFIGGGKVSGACPKSASLLRRFGAKIEGD